MSPVGKIVLLLSFYALVQSSPYDDGKYKHKTYDFYDDGKYYRPRTEGKYVPGDEGKYTFIYTKGVWPFDGTYKHLEVGDNEYQIYAPRFPYMFNLIRALTTKYESPDILTLGAGTEGAVNYFNTGRATKEIKMQCKYMEPKPKNKTETAAEFFPSLLQLQDGEKLGSIYNFKGSKVLSSGSNPKSNKLKLEYEVFVRVVEDLST